MSKAVLIGSRNGDQNDSEDVQVLEPIQTAENQEITPEQSNQEENAPEDPQGTAESQPEEHKKEEEFKLPDEPFKDITRMKLESVLSEEVYVQMKSKEIDFK